MRADEERRSSADQDDFARLAADTRPPGLVREFLQFLREEKRWWLLPILLVLALVAGLLYFAGAAAPFIYPLF